jgi:hypothetical protein
VPVSIIPGQMATGDAEASELLADARLVGEEAADAV